MKLLLDTHVFLWYIAGDAQLPAKMVSAIKNTRNDVYLSVVSLWEIIIKHRLGRLPLPENPDVYIPRQRERHLIASLPIDEASVMHLARLPAHHRDPFDRMLICQAIEHDLVLLSVDSAIHLYPVKIFDYR